MVLAFDERRSANILCLLIPEDFGGLSRDRIIDLESILETGRQGNRMAGITGFHQEDPFARAEVFVAVAVDRAVIQDPEEFLVSVSRLCLFRKILPQCFGFLIQGGFFLLSLLQLFLCYLERLFRIGEQVVLLGRERFILPDRVMGEIVVLFIIIVAVLADPNR